MSIHLPNRPDWTCAVCGQPWPCPTGKRQLLAEYSGARVSLMLYLSAHFVEACEDMPNAVLGTLHRRFFGWPREIPDEAPR
jgi:hypothetical protein